MGATPFPPPPSPYKTEEVDNTYEDEFGNTYSFPASMPEATIRQHIMTATAARRMQGWKDSSSPVKLSQPQSTAIRPMTDKESAINYRQELEENPGDWRNLPGFAAGVVSMGMGVPGAGGVGKVVNGIRQADKAIRPLTQILGVTGAGTAGSVVGQGLDRGFDNIDPQRTLNAGVGEGLFEATGAAVGKAVSPHRFQNPTTRGIADYTKEHGIKVTPGQLLKGEQSSAGSVSRGLKHIADRSVVGHAISERIEERNTVKGLRLLQEHLKFNDFGTGRPGVAANTQQAFRFGEEADASKAAKMWNDLDAFQNNEPIVSMDPVRGALFGEMGMDPTTKKAFQSRVSAITRDEKEIASVSADMLEALRRGEKTNLTPAREAKLFETIRRLDENKGAVREAFMRKVFPNLTSMDSNTAKLVDDILYSPEKVTFSDAQALLDAMNKAELPPSSTLPKGYKRWHASIKEKLTKQIESVLQTKAMKEAADSANPLLPPGTLGKYQAARDYMADHRRRYRESPVTAFLNAKNPETIIRGIANGDLTVAQSTAQAFDQAIASSKEPHKKLFQETRRELEREVLTDILIPRGANPTSPATLQSLGARLDRAEKLRGVFFQDRETQRAFSDLRRLADTFEVLGVSAPEASGVNNRWMRLGLELIGRGGLIAASPSTQSATQAIIGADIAGGALGAMLYTPAARKLFVEGFEALAQGNKSLYMANILRVANMQLSNQTGTSMFEKLNLGISPPSPRETSIGPRR